MDFITTARLATIGKDFLAVFLHYETAEIPLRGSLVDFMSSSVLAVCMLSSLIAKDMEVFLVLMGLKRAGDTLAPSTEWFIEGPCRDNKASSIKFVISHSRWKHSCECAFPGASH